jgi:hypothetical protein
MLKHELVDPQTQHEILRRYDVITKQNYLSHNKKIIIQQDGLAMGAPSSGLIAEIFLQHLEQLQLTHLARKHHIINYCRYVDDVFLIFDSNNTCIQNILKDFNALHPNMQFTAEIEENQALNFLDITVHRTAQASKWPYTGNPLSPTASYHSPQTTPHTTNTLLSDSCTID